MITHSFFVTDAECMNAFDRHKFLVRMHVQLYYAVYKSTANTHQDRP